MPTEIIFQHGFGFDSSCFRSWEPLSERSSKEFICHFGERGYFGRPFCQPAFTQDAGNTRVIVSHSLGLHLLSQEAIAAADLIVVVSGFFRFHPQEQPGRRRSQRIIQAMLQKLKTSPQTVLADFCRNCYGLPPSSPVVLPALNITESAAANLIDDLELLDKSDLDPKLLNDKRVVFIHGTQDSIVARERAAEAQQLTAGSQIYVIDGAQHALPFSHAASCWLILRQHLKLVRTEPCTLVN
jgi:hypothetical protein